jgi:hypothetical protein
VDLHIVEACMHYIVRRTAAHIGGAAEHRAVDHADR